MSFESDFAYQRRFVPCMKRIIGEHLIAEAPFEEDAQRNTDLIVLKLEAIRVACRVRKVEYMDRYRGEFTIRLDRPSGATSELAKLLSGWGDYLLYGFADVWHNRLCEWTLGDLKVFRLWYQRQTYELGSRQYPVPVRHNRDGSSRFLAFSIEALPPDFVVAHRAAEEVVA